MRALLFLAASLAWAGGGDEKAAEELSRELEQVQRQAEQVLQQVDRLGRIAPAAPAGPDRTRERALRLANDERFLRAAERLWAHEQRGTLLLAQLGFLLATLLFKAWRQSRARHWFRRLLIGLACNIFLLAGVFYGIPLAVLGEPFAVFTGTLWRVVVMGG